MSERYQLYHGDCLDILPTLQDNSIDLIVTDPPYFKVKNLAWDRQWAKPHNYLEWLDIVLGEFHRLLKPNGSLYMFASPQMSRKVANRIEQRFNILNDIRWQKPPYSTKAEMFDKDTMRSYFPASETIIFAEHYGADAPYQNALIDGNLTYWGKCESAKQRIFGDYLQSEFDRARATRKDIAALFPSRTGNLTGCVSNWLIGYNIPTSQQYKTMREYLNHRNCKTDYLKREYDYLKREYEDLRREYEDLRREYEDLRRPFNVSPDVPYTDVWTFPTVQDYPGKHPCEKPPEMIRHIIEASSRPGALVLDAFSGSGVVGEICGITGRDVILIDQSKKWFNRSQQRTAAAYGNWGHAMSVHVPRMKNGKEKRAGQLALFGANA